jgi:hypothetical protein
VRGGPAVPPVLADDRVRALEALPPQLRAWARSSLGRLGPLEPGDAPAGPGQPAVGSSVRPVGMTSATSAPTTAAPAQAANRTR